MAYRLWQVDAYRLAQRLHRKYHFSVCHLITYVGFRFPGKFFTLDCPFVWGPIGGLENTPRHFLPLLGIYGAAYYTARNLINEFDRRFSPQPRRAMKKAAECEGVIAATTAIKKEIRRWYGVESTVICEIGPPPVAKMESLVVRNCGEPLRICWSGEHLPGKALQLLLRALAMMPHDVNWRLDVLGTGPCSRKWKNEAKTIGIDLYCTFHGRLSRQEALSVMQKAHLFVITSLKDLTSTVLLEALSLGKPVISPDHCGFSDVIDESCGIKIRIENLDRFILQLARQIETLYYDEALRCQLAQGALRRIEHFSWHKKAEVVNAIYRRAVCARSKRLKPLASRSGAPMGKGLFPGAI